MLVEDAVVLTELVVLTSAGPALTGGATCVLGREAAVFGAGGSSPKQILLK